MAWLSNFFRKSKKKDTSVSEEARQRSLEIRQMNAEMRRMEHEKKVLELQLDLEERRADLEDLQNDLYEDDEKEDESIEGLLLKTLLPVLQQKINPVVTNTNTSNSNNINMTDEEIITILDKIPKTVKKHLMSLEMALFEKIVLSHYPNLSRTSIVRAHELLHQK